MLSTKRNAANACQDHALDTSHMTVLWDIPSRERTGSGKREMCPGTSPREMCRQTRKSGLGLLDFFAPNSPARDRPIAVSARQTSVDNREDDQAQHPAVQSGSRVNTTVECRGTGLQRTRLEQSRLLSPRG
ncbi:unnamed protein product [Lasius platythorax]|uniref:Uncharacterized protein n=1 Tax=Lasius platythorax TaxID=488582 RepID=A0AAV2NZC8_9HYME